jgi:hypothetical protein
MPDGSVVADDSTDGKTLGQVVPLRPTGVQTGCTAEQHGQVCALVSSGMPVRQALAGLGVNPATFYAGLAGILPGQMDTGEDSSAARDKRYSHAKQDALRAIADEAIALADAADIQSPAGVNKARLQVETRKWFLSKLAPKVYGDKLDVDHSGQVTLTLGRDDAQL